MDLLFTFPETGKIMEIFVGNLPFEITEQEIRDAFAAHGDVKSVKMLMDKFSGRFRGMAFVTMEDEAQASAAIAALNGADLGGRPMKVDKSRPREEGQRRFSGFGGGFSRNNDPREGGFGRQGGGGYGRGGRQGGFRERNFKRDNFRDDGNEFRHRKPPFRRNRNENFEDDSDSE